MSMLPVLGGYSTKTIRQENVVAVSHSRYTALSASDSTPLPPIADVFEKVKPSLTEGVNSDISKQSNKRDYQDFTEQAKDSDFVIEKHRKLNPVPSQLVPQVILPPVAVFPIPAIPVITNIFDLLPVGFPGLPMELEQKIQEIQSSYKSPSEEVADVIKQLCSIIPLSFLELSFVLNRKKMTILTGYIGPMLREGLLIVDKPYMCASNPNQKFRANQ